MTPPSGTRFKSALQLVRAMINGYEDVRVQEDCIYCYELMLEILGNNEFVNTVSKSGRLPHDKIRPAARRAIELLIFKNGGNPFQSLGLSPFATKEEIHNRWKKLISFYHPDRHMEDAVYEEAAKRINEAYKKAIEIKSRTPKIMTSPSLDSPAFRETWRDGPHPENRRRAGKKDQKNQKVSFSIKKFFLAALLLFLTIFIFSFLSGK